MTIQTITSIDDFHELVINSSQKQLVKFTADWCDPCKSMTTIDENINQLCDINVVYVDIDQVEDLASKYGVRGVPSYFIFNDGSKWDRPIVGAKSEQDMMKFVNRR